MTAQFSDRLDPATYENDDEVVGIYESDPDETDALWISGRLFRRLSAIGSAYELHTLPMLDGSTDARLNTQRCASLIDEIEFVSERANDPVLREIAFSLATYLAERVRRPGWAGDVTISFD